jgi:Ca-activated chloride channel family protein
MFEFEWIWMFLFVPLPWLASFLIPASETSTAALKIPNLNQWLAVKESHGSSFVLKRKSVWLLYLAWVCFIVGAAKPMWIGDPVSLPVSGRDLMLAIDLSGSMENPDFLMNGEKVDRLTVVKQVAGDFIERREGDRIGLILFGKRAYVQTPLTFDRKTVQYMLREAEIGLAGKETAIGDGIGLAAKRLQSRPQDSRVLILLTDGANTAGEIEPVKAAELAKELGLKIYTIGVGADSMEIQSFFGSRVVNPSADLDETTLTKIASLTGGAYFRAKDTKGLEKIYEQLDVLEPAIQEAETLRPQIALYYWPLGLGLVLAMSYVFLSLFNPVLTRSTQQ